MTYAEVAVNSGAPHRAPFTYSVPEGMTLEAGDGVFVPFGRRSLQGVVLSTTEVAPAFEVKEVDARLGDRPVVSRERIELARWIADYYLAPLFDSVALMLPPGFERRPLTFFESLIDADEMARIPLPPRQRTVIEHLAGQGRVEAGQIDKEVRQPGVAAALSQLTLRGLVRRSYGLDRPRVRAKTVRTVRLVVHADQVEAVAAGHESRRQTRLARALRLLADAGSELPASELRLRAGVTLSDLRPLAEAGLIEVIDAPVERDPLLGRDYGQREGPPLTPQQAEAYGIVDAALEQGRGRSFLLHGVTGSGKTEIYLRALERAVLLGRRGIVLVPEIALTPQTVRRFAERFPGQVAVLHSGLSQGEMFDQWHGIRDGRYAVVIGSRSALFAPQPNLGLIVIDEEHEWTYKQQEQAPRYHAREAAEKLSELANAVLILGSATPDVVSYQRALWGRHTLLELKERVRPVVDERGETVSIKSSPDMPPVEVIDLRDELRAGNRSIFSRSLQYSLFETLAKGRQAILFLNRRGTAGFVQCRDCGYVPQCSACAIALSFHRYLGSGEAGRERLLCHQCNRGRSMYARCPICGGDRLRPMGLGVERVEEEVREVFPEARTLRWDRDVTRGRHAHEEILSRFVKGDADVLIGTQMVAKGLDLPAVILVGVISADIGLHVPDFRSAERTFQLLTQVSGRSGRALPVGGGPPPGRVVVQTYTPDNYAVVAAAGHDYAEFFAAEIEFRRKEAYPPFVRLARLVYSDANAERGERAATRMASQLRDEARRLGLPGVDAMGPAPPHVPKWHGRFRWQIIVRAQDPVELLADVQLPQGWALDIDPASLA
jgi:primosomal protein N' (replication factor Y) (superfamily II helicase)